MKFHQIAARLSRFTLIIISLSACSKITDEMSGSNRYKAPQIEQFIEVVPQEDFSGTWRAANANTAISIDIQQRTFVTVGGIEMKIEDAVPIDGGYALLRHASEWPNHPHGLYQLAVIKKIDDDTIAVMFSGGLISVFLRDRSD